MSWGLYPFSGKVSRGHSAATSGPEWALSKKLQTSIQGTWSAEGSEHAALLLSFRSVDQALVVGIRRARFFWLPDLSEEIHFRVLFFLSGSRKS